VKDAGRIRGVIDDRAGLLALFTSQVVRNTGGSETPRERQAKLPDLLVIANGDGLDSESLRDWLNRELCLRGRVIDEIAQTSDEEMGAVSTLTITALTSGMITALAQSISVWLKQRRSDVSITIRKAGGRAVTLDAKRVENAESLIRTLLDEE
jgi:Effector Associated Constant Component 1